MRATSQALALGIQSCGPGKPFKGIGQVCFPFHPILLLKKLIQYLDRRSTSMRYKAGTPSLRSSRDTASGRCSIVRRGYCTIVRPLPLILFMSCDICR